MDIPIPDITITGQGEAIGGNLDPEHMSMGELRAPLDQEGIAIMSQVRWAIRQKDSHGGVSPQSALPA